MHLCKFKFSTRFKQPKKQPKETALEEMRYFSCSFVYLIKSEEETITKRTPYNNVYYIMLISALKF